MDADLEFVEQARNGSQEAFGLLVARHQSRIYNLARALAGPDNDTEDLAQEVFLKAYRGLASFRGESSFRTWLYRIALNVIRSHASRGSLWSRLGFRRGDRDEGSDDPLAQLAAPGDVEMDVVRRDAIDKALGRLSPELREAVTLRDIEGLEYKEMAAVLDVPIGTVMSRISRGRERLRPLLAPVNASHPGSRRKGEGGA